jgi:hypothetical protein
MGVYRIYERQTIVYSWLVQAEDLDEAMGGADAGVPDGAITEKFHSDNDVELVEDPLTTEDVYDLQGRIIDDEEVA